MKTHKKRLGFAKPVADGTVVCERHRASIKAQFELCPDLEAWFGSFEDLILVAADEQNPCESCTIRALR